MKDVDVTLIMRAIDILIDKAEKYDEYIKEQGSTESIKRKAEKFYCKSLTTDIVAKMHDVSKATVIKYVKLGLIPIHPNSTDGKILIRASDGITLDFDDLKYKSKYIR